MNQTAAKRYSWHQDDEFVALVDEWIGRERDPQIAALKLKLIIRQELLVQVEPSNPTPNGWTNLLAREGEVTKPKVWLSRADAAKIIGVNSKTLANWKTQGVGPSVRKFGRRPLYLESDLRDWIAQHWAPERG